MKIVIADGQESDREAVKRILEQAGEAYEPVGTAKDGKAAYSLIKEERPDLVIMDICLPKISGLSMLKKLRSEKNDIKVLILTADTDFERARQAISLGIDNYLLKPVKADQLKRAVDQIAEKIKGERTLLRTFTVENIFMGCLNGQLGSDHNLAQIIRERYGFTFDDPGGVFTLWLDQDYTACKEDAQRLLKKTCQEKGYAVGVLEVGMWRMLAAVIYKVKAGKPEYHFFQEHMVPLLRGSLPGEAVCLWGDMERLAELPARIQELKNLREWNLVLDRGELITPQDIKNMKISTVKYPADLEERLRHAVTSENEEEIRKCYSALYDMLRHELYAPAEIKECMIRFNLSAVDAYKTRHVVRSELQIQHCMRTISEAVSWRQIRVAIEKFIELIRCEAFTEGKDEDLSPLVRQAVQLIRKYYDQGITLEETADRLYVSEEYLSTQFKKETGTGFTETVRRCRIERIKYLLLNTRLKLNQIAELTGYADPKYMSRVFKEETGILPNEYRKALH